VRKIRDDSTEHASSSHDPIVPVVPDDPQLRVLHVIGNLDVGGAQEVVRSLAPALAGCGVQASVLTLRDGPMREALEADGVRVHVVPGRRRSLVRDPRAWSELLRIRRDVTEVVERERADILQTHLLSSLDFLMLGVGTRRRRPSVIWTFHNARLDLRPDQLPAGDPTLGLKRRGYRLGYRSASRVAAALVAVSGEVGRSVASELHPAPGRLVVIPNGVQVDRYGEAGDRDAARDSLGVPRDAFLLICVAKLYEQKGHAVLLDAFAGLQAAEGVHLVLVGDGPLRAQLAERVRDSSLQGRVHLGGIRDDIPSLLAASDAFVLPSLWEGLPMALLEAMASGLPIVASRVAGTEEVLAGTEAGTLVQPGDVDALAAALERVIGDAELRGRLGAAARERVAERYSVAAQAAAHAALYRDVMARRRRRP
jgi:glycosyltransferase involved in cell wall biosynthesis